MIIVSKVPKKVLVEKVIIKLQAYKVKSVKKSNIGTVACKKTGDLVNLPYKPGSSS